MKFAFMTWSTPDLTLDETLVLASQLGYDGIEIRTDCSQRHGVETSTSAGERKEIKQRAERAGISLCCVATSCKLANSESAEAEINSARQSISLASDIGAGIIRVFGGPLTEGQSRDQGITVLADSLRKLAPFAAESHVTVCLETHDSWTHPEEVAAVMQKVDHPAVAVNWDFLHSLWRHQIAVPKSYQILRPWIRHVHVHDYQLGEGSSMQVTNIGEGDVDHRVAVELLKADNFQGYVSGEWIGREEDFRTYLKRELDMLRSYED